MYGLKPVITKNVLEDEIVCVSTLKLEVRVTEYCRRIPFCRLGDGGSQEMYIDWEFCTLRLMFLGGPEGAEATIIIIAINYVDVYWNTISPASSVCTTIASVKGPGSIVCATMTH